MPSLLTRFLSCLDLGYATVRCDGPTQVRGALGFDEKSSCMISDLKALSLLCFLDLGLPLDFQAPTIDVHVVSIAGGFAASAAAAAAITRASFALPILW